MPSIMEQIEALRLREETERLTAGPVAVAVSAEYVDGLNGALNRVGDERLERERQS